MKLAANNKFEMFVHNVGPIFFNKRGSIFILFEARFLGKFARKSAFLASKLGNRPLLELWPLIEIKFGSLYLKQYGSRSDCSLRAV